MRRDYFDVTVRTADSTSTDAAPEIVVAFDGPTETIAERLDEPDAGGLEGDQIDVTVRLQTPLDGADDPEGVLSVTDRVTGQFIIEANLDAASVEALVETARERPDDQTDYAVRITDAAGASRVYEKRTLLVYDVDGSLRRSSSLIPGGVEL
ncbi:MAG: DUF5793 family protein [Haloarculaceae archaeon]